MPMMDMPPRIEWLEKSHIANPVRVVGHGGDLQLQIDRMVREWFQHLNTLSFREHGCEQPHPRSEVSFEVPPIRGTDN